VQNGVCLTVLSFLEDEMKNQGIPQLEAVFISVDPDRDTPEVMKNYLKGKFVFCLHKVTHIVHIHYRVKHMLYKAVGTDLQIYI